MNKVHGSQNSYFPPLPYLLLTSIMELILLEAPVPGLNTLQVNTTVLSSPSGAQVNLLPMTV